MLTRLQLLLVDEGDGCSVGMGFSPNRHCEILVMAMDPCRRSVEYVETHWQAWGHRAHSGGVDAVAVVAAGA